ncbi:MAG TPA: helix-turn-helix domain-containing protein [Candidatus Thermoplasmatota archaeon]|nr:helix-turn-helix domain-containing protein [Candidatus Thermoplasmatota archaeon]
MRIQPAFLIILLVLGCTPENVGAANPLVDFAQPASAVGALTTRFDGTLTILPSREKEFSLSLTNSLEGGWSNRTVAYAVADTSLSGTPIWLHEFTSSGTASVPNESTIILPPESTGFLTLEAENILLTFASNQANLVLANENGDAHAFLPYSPGIDLRDVHASPFDVILFSDQVSEMKLEAGNLKKITWSDVSIQCPTSPCMEGSHPTSVVQAAKGVRLGYGTKSVMQIRVDNEVGVRGTGFGSFLLASSPKHDLLLDGRLRLPLANAQCSACSWTADHTLTAEGHLELNDLRRSNDRMQASVGGDISHLQSDEEIVSSAVLFTTAIAGTTATAGILLLTKFLGSFFFTKLKGDPLEHPRRRRIFDYIKDHPGATFREVARGVEIATGTTRHHLTVLKRNGVIMERPHGSTTRFFENHGKFEATWNSVVLLREPALKQLHDWLLANPEVPQKDVLEAMAGHGWSRSTTQHRLQRLVEGGMAELRLQGRLKIYKVSAQKPRAGPGLFVPSPMLGATTSLPRTPQPVAPLS